MIISVITSMIILYTLCKHNKLRALVVSLALQQVREVKAEVRDGNYKCKCISQFYIIFSFKYSNNRSSYVCNFTG